MPSMAPQTLEELLKAVAVRIVAPRGTARLGAWGVVCHSERPSRCFGIKPKVLFAPLFVAISGKSSATLYPTRWRFLVQTSRARLRNASAFWVVSLRRRQNGSKEYAAGITTPRCASHLVRFQRGRFSSAISARTATTISKAKHPRCSW